MKKIVYSDVSRANRKNVNDIPTIGLATLLSHYMLAQEYLQPSPNNNERQQRAA